VVADVLNRVRQPFNVNSLALAAACAALKDDEYLAKVVAQRIRHAATAGGLP
jgi:histidinol-phosphate/aromatic aminotransferase/cobyric acid decarboxylase-like protein